LFVSAVIFHKAPRYVVFDKSRKVRPFYTEFAVFQSAPAPESNNEAVSDSGGDGADVEPPPQQLPSLVCSKMSRAYDEEGRLQQGCTSFYTFKRFGAEKDDEKTY